MNQQRGRQVRAGDLPPDVCACQYPQKELLPDLVTEVVAEIERRGAVDHVCREPLPNSQTIIHTLDLLCEVLFPGYFSRQALDRSNLPYYIGQTLNTVYGLLCQEISRCLMHERPRCTIEARLECEEQARRHTYALLGKLPGLARLLESDVQAGYMGDPAATGPKEVIFCYPGFRAVMIQRIAHELYLQGVRWLPRMMTEYAHGITGIDIHPGAKIGKNFFIDHGTGVVIGETTEIGDNVRLYQGVTLGAWSFQTDERGNLLRGYKRHPTVEDDVIIYSNASILGPAIIGRGSVVGSNVLLTESVEPGSQVFTGTTKPRVKPRDR